MIVDDKQSAFAQLLFLITIMKYLYLNSSKYFQNVFEFYFFLMIFFA